MQVIKNENTRPFDVDGTLIIHNPLGTHKVYDSIDNRYIRFTPNLNMIRLLKEEYARGGHIIVWSRGGYAWAESIINALELKSYVHVVMTKPMVYFDDSDVSVWMKDRVFIAPEENYKKEAIVIKSELMTMIKP